MSPKAKAAALGARRPQGAKAKAGKPKPTALVIKTAMKAAKKLSGKFVKDGKEMTLEEKMAKYKDTQGEVGEEIFTRDDM